MFPSHDQRVSTPQKGPDITIPLSGDAPVKGIGSASPYTFVAGGNNIHESDGTTRDYAQANTTSASGAFQIEEDPNNAGYPNVYADLSNATAANVNDWRRAFALQRYQEARQKYGARYPEYLRYLGVAPSDQRIGRPEYLGGGSGSINFSEVLATAETTSVNVGDLKGHGIAAIRTRPFTRFFSEHGYFISVMSIRPRTVYQTGMLRTYLRQTKEDFWQRELLGS